MSDRNYEAARSMDEEYDQDEATLVAFRKFVTELADAEDDVGPERHAEMGDIETTFRALDEVDRLRERVADLEHENQQLRERLDKLGDIGENQTTKETKIARIVSHADNVREGEDKPAVTMLPKTITGAAGVGRRYAYDLVDDMINGDGENGTVGPDGYDWAHDPSDLPQHLEKDQPQKGVLIDFEGVHGEPVPVNKFTTRTSGQGVAD